MTEEELIRAYAERLAEKYALKNWSQHTDENHLNIACTITDFQAGFAAGREVGRLEGGIEELTEAAPEVDDSFKYLKRASKELKENLSALLAERET